MEQCKLSEVNERIREAAQQAAAVDGLSVPVVERFLRTGDETWDGAGSGRFTLAQFKEDEAYTRAAKAGLRTLLHLLASLLPAEAQSAPQVAPDMMRRRIEPMVKGLVQDDWQEIAFARDHRANLHFELPGGHGGHRRRIVDVFRARRGGFYGPCSGIMGSSQKMLK